MILHVHTCLGDCTVDIVLTVQLHAKVSFLRIFTQIAMESEGPVLSSQDPPYACLRFVSILYFYLHLGLTSDHLPSG